MPIFVIFKRKGRNIMRSMYTGDFPTTNVVSEAQITHQTNRKKSGNSYDDANNVKIRANLSMVLLDTLINALCR